MRPYLEMRSLCFLISINLWTLSRVVLLDMVIVNIVMSWRCRYIFWLVFSPIARNVSIERSHIRPHSLAAHITTRWPIYPNYFILVYLIILLTITYFTWKPKKLRFVDLLRGLLYFCGRSINYLR